VRSATCASLFRRGGKTVAVWVEPQSPSGAVAGFVIAVGCWPVLSWHRPGSAAAMIERESAVLLSLGHQPSVACFAPSCA
jgi:hypothetical protein